MDYRSAKKVRGTSLSDMILGKMAAGGGVTSSISKSISEKISAKATGLKEKFDPLNMIKFATGGSKLATGIAGKIMGRKQSDIDYFTGRKSTRTASRIDLRPMENMEASTSSQILSNIYEFMVKSHEEDKQIREIQRSFQEEKDNESKRRHKEFLGKLKEFVELKQQPEIRIIGQKEPGLLSQVGDMMKGFANSIKTLVSNIASFVTSLFDFLATTIIGKMISTFFNKMKDWLFIGLKNVLQLVFLEMPKLIIRTLISILGRTLMMALRFLANPLVLGVLGTVVAGVLAGKLLSDFMESETGLGMQIKTLETQRASLQNQLQYLVPPQTRPDGTIFDPDASKREGLTKRLDVVNQKIKEKTEELEKAKAVSQEVSSGAQKQSIIPDWITNFFGGKKEKEDDDETLLGKVKSKFQANNTINFSDITGDSAENLKNFIQKRTGDFISTVPNISDTENQLNNATDENVSLMHSRDFDTQTPDAGNLINETYVSPPSVRENSTPATAAVRDDTPIFASAFNSSRVFV